MTQRHEDCNNCPHESKCSEIYGKLGTSSGESVAVKVCIAFLVPLTVFALSIGLIEKKLRHSIERQTLRELLSFVIAAVIAAAATLILRFIYEKFFKKTFSCKDKTL